MDLLRALNLDDLPEQQTRTLQLSEAQPDYQLFLGIDACCTCGKPKPSVDCSECNRVKYCSTKCMQADAKPPPDDDEQALGHSSVICSLLKLCNHDEAVLDQDTSSLEESAKVPSFDRISSELESYPASLANIIFEGPCYQDMLHQKRNAALTVHIIGASDAELWREHPDTTIRETVCKAYADAFSEMAQHFGLSSVNLIFCGLECPKNFNEQAELKQKSQSKASKFLNIKTFRKAYNQKNLAKATEQAPDVVVFFNPGFTCPDYEWTATLASIPSGMPYLTTTNTELEGIADVQYLVENGYIGGLPVGLAEVLGIESAASDEDTDTFFNVNPYSGTRVRQSGTMANDLYVKNRWILGGLWGTQKRTAVDGKPAKKLKTSTKSAGNNKKANPALI